jgi:hypothetical protein
MNTMPPSGQVATSGPISGINDMLEVTAAKHVGQPGKIQQNRRFQVSAIDRRASLGRKRLTLGIPGQPIK